MNNKAGRTVTWRQPKHSINIWAWMGTHTQTFRTVPLSVKKKKQLLLFPFTKEAADCRASSFLGSPDGALKSQQQQHLEHKTRWEYKAVTECVFLYLRHTTPTARRDILYLWSRDILHHCDWIRFPLWFLFWELKLAWHQWGCSSPSNIPQVLWGH